MLCMHTHNAQKNEKFLRVCTSILSYIDHSLVKIVHGHISYNQIKFIYLTASKFTKTNTNVDALRGKIDGAVGKPLERR